MNYRTFHIDSTNSWGLKDRLYRIQVIEHKDANTMEEAVLLGRGYHQTGYASCLTRIKATMQAEKERLLQRIQQLDYNLDNLEALYPPPSDFESALQQEYAALVKGFQNLAQEEGEFCVGPLAVTNNYLHGNNPELFVFSLPEYSACPQTFSEKMCAIIDQAMVDAGLEVYREWNGAGCFTWSRRARVKQTTAVMDMEA